MRAGALGGSVCRPLLDGSRELLPAARDPRKLSAAAASAAGDSLTGDIAPRSLQMQPAIRGCRSDASARCTLSRATLCVPQITDLCSCACIKEALQLAAQC